MIDDSTGVGLSKRISAELVPTASTKIPAVKPPLPVFGGPQNLLDSIILSTFMLFSNLFFYNLLIERKEW